MRHAHGAIGLHVLDQLRRRTGERHSTVAGDRLLGLPQACHERQRYVIEIAAERFGHAAQIVQHGGEFRRAQFGGLDGAQRVPAVGIAGGAAQRGHAMAADPDRGVRLLHRQRLAAHGAEAVVLALVLDRAGGPELLENAHPFIGDRAAAGEWGGVQSLELLRHPADADAERDAALRQDVDGGDRFRGQHRVPVRQDQHRCDQPQRAGAPRHEGDQAQRFHRVAVAGVPARGVVGIRRLHVGRDDDVVGDGRRGEAQSLPMLHHPCNAIEVGQFPAHRQGKSVLHGRSPACFGAGGIIGQKLSRAKRRADGRGVGIGLRSIAGRFGLDHGLVR